MMAIMSTFHFSRMLHVPVPSIRLPIHGTHSVWLGIRSDPRCTKISMSLLHQHAHEKVVGILVTFRKFYGVHT